MRRFLRRFAPILLTLAIVGGGVVLAESPALAQVQTYEYCNTSNWCLNAWGGGGSYVNEYDANVVNDYFNINGNNSGWYDIDQVDPTQSFTENCIGDLNNSSTNARAAVQYGCTNTSRPWGALVDPEFCDNEAGYTFYDLHWHGYIGPANPQGRGTAIYLNQATPTCWLTYSQS